MSRIYSSEQVSRGHVDKICDQIADAIVTDCLAHDKDSRVAVEVLIKNETVVVTIVFYFNIFHNSYGRKLLFLFIDALCNHQRGLKVEDYGVYFTVLQILHCQCARRIRGGF